MVIIKLTSYYCFCPFPYSDWYRKKILSTYVHASSHRFSNINNIIGKFLTRNLRKDHTGASHMHNRDNTKNEERQQRPVLSNST